MVYYKIFSVATVLLASAASTEGFTCQPHICQSCVGTTQHIPLHMTIDENNENENEEQKLPIIDYAELEEIQMTEEELAKEVHLYKLRTQIDSILNDPDGAPFDLGTELKKVTGGISPALPPDSPEMAIEQNLYEVESQMYEAVNKKDYERAQKKKEELSKMHIDDVGSVLQVNSAFYRAFSNKDYEAMQAVWLHDASAFCIHPSSAPLIGAKNVLNSWKEMFAGGNEAFQKNKIEPTNIRLSVKGTSAIITCDEEVYTKRFVRGKKRVGEEGKNGMEQVNKLVTTNIFRKVNGKWYMVHHHATWHHESEASKKALKAQIGSKPKSNENGSASLEELLGIPGHEGLGGDKESSSKKGPVRKVFRGSLSDLLGGGLGDILGEGGDSADNASSDDGDLGIESIIIRSEDLNLEGGGIESGNRSDDDDDDDNSAKKGAIPVNAVPSPSDSKPQAKDSIRQSCIKALRKLASEGAISQKHKRMLLTDIIVKSAEGDYSMVEVAFDLLCNESEDSNAGQEDFVEQCKVFAATLPEIPISMGTSERQQ